jgi:hypothetical protein
MVIRYRPAIGGPLASGDQDAGEGPARGQARTRAANLSHIVGGVYALWL